MGPRSSIALIAILAGSATAHAGCPELDGDYTCGAFKATVVQSRLRGFDRFEIKQFQQDPAYPFEQGDYLADGQPHAASDDVGSETSITSSCKGDALIIQEASAYVPFATEIHYSRDGDRLIIQNGVNQNGKFKSDDQHKAYCDLD